MAMVAKIISRVLKTMLTPVAPPMVTVSFAPPVPTTESSVRFVVWPLVMVMVPVEISDSTELSAASVPAYTVCVPVRSFVISTEPRSSSLMIMSGP